jgi:hypothetical protein
LHGAGLDHGIERCHALSGRPTVRSGRVITGEKLT